MAKSQKRNSREPKKPKMKKVAAPAPTAVDFKGISATSDAPKKKKG